MFRSLIFAYKSVLVFLEAEIKLSFGTITAWMIPLLLTTFKPNIDHLIVRYVKVSDLDNKFQNRNLSMRNNILPNEIIHNMEVVPIPLTYIDDKLIWKLIIISDFLIEMATWANNDRVHPHLKAKLLNAFWRLNLFHCVKLFVWQLICKKFAYQM